MQKARLIIDDFRMLKLDGQTQHDFEQIIDDRYQSNATMLCSQLPVADWYNIFQSELIAEACLDRIVHKAVKFDLWGESLRKSINRANDNQKLTIITDGVKGYHRSRRTGFARIMQTVLYRKDRAGVFRRKTHEKSRFELKRLKN